MSGVTPEDAKQWWDIFSTVFGWVKQSCKAISARMGQAN
jgi:hypothetical protein